MVDIENFFLLGFDEGLWESLLVVGISVLIGLNLNSHGRGELMKRCPGFNICQDVLL